jgi:hypothetical protein
VRYFTKEIVLLIEILLQAFYLKYKSSTYGEAFYGFKRSAFVFKNGTKFLVKLSIFKIIVIIFFETILPYLKEKILENVGSKKLKTLVYASELLVFGYKFRYLIDSKFAHFKPYPHFFNILIRRQN